MIRKAIKAFVIINAIGYTIYKLRLDEKLIRALEPGYRELVASLKAKSQS